jgi:hypothetical protein
MWRVSIHAPKDSLLYESFFAAKVVFYCWPYAFTSSAPAPHGAGEWNVVNTAAQGQQSPHLLRGARIVASARADRKRQNERTNPVVINFDASTL